jgi:hypothetical protein
LWTSLPAHRVAAANGFRFRVSSSSLAFCVAVSFFEPERIISTIDACRLIASPRLICFSKSPTLPSMESGRLLLPPLLLLLLQLLPPKESALLLLLQLPAEP